MTVTCPDCDNTITGADDHDDDCPKVLVDPDNLKLLVESDGCGCIHPITETHIVTKGPGPIEQPSHKVTVCTECNEELESKKI